MPAVINRQKCIGCFHCVDICPTDAYGPQEPGSKAPVIQYPEECWHCNACVFECPAKAIRLRLAAPCSMVFVEAIKKENEFGGGRQ